MGNKDISKKDWLLTISTLLGAALFDQLTKIAEASYNFKFSSAFINIQLVFNKGLVGGYFSGFPPILSTVAVSCIGIILLTIYFAVLFLLPVRVLDLRIGISILMGGVLGNICDRIFLGKVVDFIVLKVSTQANPALNVADIFQWVGLILTAIAIVRHNFALWPENNMRKLKSVKPKFQNRYTFLVLGAVFGSALLSWVLSFSFLRSTVLASLHAESETAGRILGIFCTLFFVAQIIYLGAAYIVVKIVSGRAAGPIFAFERFINRILEGRIDFNAPGLRLRAKDDFKELETLAAQIQDRVAQIKPRAPRE